MERSVVKKMGVSNASIMNCLLRIIPIRMAHRHFHLHSHELISSRGIGPEDEAREAATQCPAGTVQISSTPLDAC